MSASGPKGLPTIGFLTVVENDEWGMTGGLLVLNAAGRPLEFHCTAPIKPNRAQEILYGPTLRPFLYGEQISQTLLSKAKSETLFICTDVEPALCVRDFVSLPVVLLSAPLTDPLETQTTTDNRVTASAPPHSTRTRHLAEFKLGTQSAAVLTEHVSDRDVVIDRWRPYEDRVDLQEPFGRIRGALAEAQRGAAK